MNTFIFLSHLIATITFPLNIIILKYCMHGKSSTKAVNFSRYFTIGCSFLYSLLLFPYFEMQSSFCILIYILRHALFIALFVVTLALIIDLLNDPIETHKNTKTERKKEEMIIFAVIIFEMFFGVFFIMDKGEFIYNKNNKQCYITQPTALEFIFTFGFAIYFVVFILVQFKLFYSIGKLMTVSNEENVYRRYRIHLIRQVVISSIFFVPYLVLRIFQLVNEFGETDGIIDYSISYNKAVEIYTYCMPTLIVIMLMDPIKMIHEEKPKKKRKVSTEEGDINVSLREFENHDEENIEN